MTEITDVWTLAGLEPTSLTSSQPAVGAGVDLSRYWAGLPEWLTERLQEYIAHRQRRWKPSQVRNRTTEQLKTLRRIWRWLLEQEAVGGTADLQRAHVQRFVEARLAGEISPVTVNNELTTLWAFLHHLTFPSTLMASPDLDKLIWILITESTGKNLSTWILAPPKEISCVAALVSAYSTESLFSCA